MQQELLELRKYRQEAEAAAAAAREEDKKKGKPAKQNSKSLRSAS